MIKCDPTMVQSVSYVEKGEELAHLVYNQTENSNGCKVIDDG